MVQKRYQTHPRIKLDAVYGVEIATTDLEVDLSALAGVAQCHVPRSAGIVREGRIYMWLTTTAWQGK